MNNNLKYAIRNLSGLDKHQQCLSGEVSERAEALFKYWNELLSCAVDVIMANKLQPVDVLFTLMSLCLQVLAKKGKIR